MAVGWGTNLDSASLTLTSSYQTIQRSAADWEIDLEPNQIASVLVKFDPQPTPADDLEIVFAKSLDGGTDYESDALAWGFTVENSLDPAHKGTALHGAEYRRFRMRAKQTGATDTTNAVVVEVSIATLS